MYTLDFNYPKTWNNQCIAVNFLSFDVELLFLKQKACSTVENAIPLIQALPFQWPEQLITQAQLNIPTLMEYYTIHKELWQVLKPYMRPHPMDGYVPLPPYPYGVLICRNYCNQEDYDNHYIGTMLGTFDIKLYVPDACGKALLEAQKTNKMLKNSLSVTKVN